MFVHGWESTVEDLNDIRIGSLTTWPNISSKDPLTTIFHANLPMALQIRGNDIQGGGRVDPRQKQRCRTQRDLLEHFQRCQRHVFSVGSAYKPEWRISWSTNSQDRRQNKLFNQQIMGFLGFWGYFLDKARMDF